MFALSLLYNCIMGTSVLFLLLLNLSYDELTMHLEIFSRKRKIFFFWSGINLYWIWNWYNSTLTLCFSMCFFIFWKIDCKCCQSRSNCSRGYIISAVVKEVGRWVFPRWKWVYTGWNSLFKNPGCKSFIRETCLLLMYFMQISLVECTWLC